ncbi:hypothetical protein ACWEPZ_37725 [Streptomyces sp. NPDC004288]|uniref:hypothetical protein n=1 Tax=Streptomyces sp. NPDC005574 TaxID=3156891 RepID=UPI0033B21EBA
MTTVKIDPKVLADVEKAIRPHAKGLFTNLGSNVMAIVELSSVERIEPGPDEEKPDTVKVRIVDMEVASDEFTDERLRQLSQELYQRRTSEGTFDSLTA